MKIDQDLRAAIRSAEKMQPNNDTWQVREANEKKSIADFMKKFPAKARRIKFLTSTITRTANTLEIARKELCESFGLRETGKDGYKGVQFAHCDSERKNFEKAGGKRVTVNQKWRFDSVMSELAAADPKQLQTILKKYGINWK